MSFTPEKLLHHLLHTHQPPAESGCYQVAFSGGLDSHVLLHALCGMRDRLPGGEPLAVHVDHGLNPDSAAWSEHCRRVCLDLDIPLTVCRVDASAATGESPEAAARNARYAALSACLRKGDVLLTAQHGDDQMETVLLQLLRGAGPKGLAGMPEDRPLGEGVLSRPLLDFTRHDLHAWALQQNLQWCEDPSNANLQYDRNFLRQEILPRLTERWPSAALTVRRSARLCAQSAQLQEERAREDFAGAQTDHEEVLNIPAIRQLNAPGQTGVLRHWFAQLQLPMPSEVFLLRILTELLDAREDAQPVVEWAGHSLRRYRDGLFLLRQTPQAPDGWQVTWNSGDTITLPGNLGTLHWHTGKPVSGSFEIRARTGGERFQQQGRAHSHSLKKVLQQRGMPPWVRTSLPLVYQGARLIAVPGLGVAEGFEHVAANVVWLDLAHRPWW